MLNGGRKAQYGTVSAAAGCMGSQRTIGLGLRNRTGNHRTAWTGDPL